MAIMNFGVSFKLQAVIEMCYLCLNLRGSML
jgi:hypothetical protein